MSEEKKPRTPYFTKELMSRENRPEGWWFKGLQLTEFQVREAMKNSRSNKEAARWLGINELTWRKYAKQYIDEETGKDLYELHKNAAGRGIPKHWVGGDWKKGVDNMLRERQSGTPRMIQRLKRALMRDGRLGFQCAACKYGEKRLTDMKAPLLIHFKNGKKSDWRIENLQWLCYNCYFLFVGDLFVRHALEKVEVNDIADPAVENQVKQVYELDEFYYQHLKKLGLEGQGDVRFKKEEEEETPDDGSEFIDIKK